MDVKQFSCQYDVRDLLPSDAETVYEALKNNTIFYRYHPPMLSLESILEDMAALPPNKGYDAKHYIGYFSNGVLVAVMDLIENYPCPKTALIGFFSVNTAFQGNGVGTAIISDCADHLAQLGFERARLGIDKGNPQSKAFWTKNGFALTGEEFPGDVFPILMMERTL